MLLPARRDWVGGWGPEVLAVVPVALPPRTEAPLAVVPAVGAVDEVPVGSVVALVPPKVEPPKGGADVVVVPLGCDELVPPNSDPPEVPELAAGCDVPAPPKIEPPKEGADVAVGAAGWDEELAALCPPSVNPVKPLVGAATVVEIGCEVPEFDCPVFENRFDFVVVPGVPEPDCPVFENKFDVFAPDGVFTD